MVDVLCIELWQWLMSNEFTNTFTVCNYKSHWDEQNPSIGKTTSQHNCSPNILLKEREKERQFSGCSCLSLRHLMRVFACISSSLRWNNQAAVTEARSSSSLPLSPSLSEQASREHLNAASFWRNTLERWEKQRSKTILSAKAEMTHHRIYKKPLFLCSFIL